MSVEALIMMGTAIILVYIIFIEIFTIIFRLTGLTNDKARFQVISLFTNSGFTTQEAELIVNSRVRRRIANVTMLSGFILNVTVISVLVNVFITLGSAKSSDVLLFFLFIGGFFIIVFLLKKLRVFEFLLRGFVERITNRVIYGGGSNIIEILDNVGANTIAQVKVINVPEPLKDKTLEISNIRKDYMINVLAIITGRETNANVTKDDIIKKDDKVIVYGKVVNIKKLFLKTQE
ncbi:MAG: TrkA C-terminal domain-containing protein [Candidatus Izemoplasmatales bacterium]|nr:TrkA C-terminal domain-containing protein [Candidatus Izemoplasmatales bacterium]